MSDFVRAEIDDFVSQVMLQAIHDPAGKGLDIKLSVMRRRIQHEVMLGETNLRRLLDVALGEEVVVPLPKSRSQRSSVGAVPRASSQKVEALFRPAVLID